MDESEVRALGKIYGIKTDDPMQILKYLTSFTQISYSQSWRYYNIGVPVEDPDYSLKAYPELRTRIEQLLTGVLGIHNKEFEVLVVDNNY